MKELELEAKERQRENAQRLNKSLGRGETNPQTFADSSLLNDDPEPYHPERRRVDTASGSVGSTTHTAQTKTPAKRDKSEGEAREQAAKLLGTNRDYVSKIKKLEAQERKRLLSGTRSNPGAKQVEQTFAQPAAESSSSLESQPTHTASTKSTSSNKNRPKKRRRYASVMVF